MSGPKKSRIVEMPDVKPTDDEVLIKIKYVGVCRSEHYDWSTAKEGQAFGHEPMGVIAAVGKNVKGYQVGDRVSGLWGSMLPGGGALVQYHTADPRCSTIVKIPDNLRDVDAILEPLSCMLSAAAKVRIGVPGDEVCVVGCGYMGCGLVSLLKLKGARVIAVDVRPESLANAKRFGADETYLPDEALRKFNPPGARDPYSIGFNVVMEWAESNESLDLAINLTRQCGQLCVGAYHTGPKRLVDMQQLGVKAIDLLNTHPREADLNRRSAINAVQLLSSGAWNYHHLPVKVFPMNGFDLANEEFETKHGKYMKAVIDMEKEDEDATIV